MRWLAPDEAARAAHLPARPGARALRGRADGMNRERFPGLAAGSWARLDGPAGTQMVDSRDRGDGRLDALRPRAPTTAARSPPRTRPTSWSSRRARARARCSARRRAEIVFGFSMTALTMAFAGAVGRTLAAGRRDRLHAARPRRQRRPVGHPRRARGRDRALRRARPGDARAARERGRGRAVGRARAGSRSPTPPTPSARSRTWPASSPPPTTRARACTSTPCTPRRTAGSTSPRSAATRSRARPTSGSARTSASSGRGPSCSPS